MTRLYRLPYLLPKAERVKAAEWNLVTVKGTQSLGVLYPEWDAAVPVRVAVTVEADLAGILADCTLSSDSLLRLAATWYSAGTGLRGIGTFIDLTPQLAERPLVLEVEAAGDVLSKSITLSVFLILARPGTTDGPLAPRLHGSYLWRGQKNLLLEGEGARFPMEVVDFAESGWLPADAAWFLDWNSDDFDRPVLGAVRLYLNGRHKRVIQAVSGGDKTDRAVRETIKYEVARAMIVAALNNEEFCTQPDSYGDGTVGEAIRRLLRLLFGGESIESLRKELGLLPHFESRLQHSLKLFWDERD